MFLLAWTIVFQLFWDNSWNQGLSSVCWGRERDKRRAEGQGLNLGDGFNNNERRKWVMGGNVRTREVRGKPGKFRRILENVESGDDQHWGRSTLWMCSWWLWAEHGHEVTVEWLHEVGGGWGGDKPKKKKVATIKTVMYDPIYVKLYVCTCVRSVHKKCIIGCQLGDWRLSHWDDYRWFILYFVIFLNFKLLCVSSNFKNKHGWFIEPKPTTTQLLLLCGKQLVREGIWNFILCWPGEEKDLTLPLTC